MFALCQVYQPRMCGSSGLVMASRRRRRCPQRIWIAHTKVHTGRDGGRVRRMQQGIVRECYMSTKQEKRP